MGMGCGRRAAYTRSMANRSQLLTIDGLANLLFGLFLLASPRSFFEALGLPWTNRSLYATILGGVLIGIGFALMLESRRPGGLVGLGLGGAVAINLTAGLVIAGWLLLSGADGGSGVGRIVLWFLVLFLVGLSSAEIVSYRRSNSDTS